MKEIFLLLFLSGCSFGSEYEPGVLPKRTEFDAQIKRILPKMHMCEGMLATPRKNTVTKRPMCSNDDTHIFSGLLSTVYPQWDLCDGFRRSVDNRGRPWRSPEHVDVDPKNAYSRDQYLGFALANINCNLTPELKRVDSYAKTHEFKICSPDDDGRCILTPSILFTMGRVYSFLGLSRPGYMDPSRFERYIDEKTDSKAVSEVTLGYRVHLIMSKMYLRTRVGGMTDAYKDIVRKGFRRQPENLFYMWLALHHSGGKIDGRTWDTFRDQLRGYLDTFEPVPEGSNDAWYWESLHQDVRKMGADLLFMACLYRGGCEDLL